MGYGKIKNITIFKRYKNNIQVEEITNEEKVVLAGSELEAILLTSVLDNDEETVRGLLKRYADRGEILDRDYQKAHKYNQIQKKNELHAMIWTNDIRVDTYK